MSLHGSLGEGERVASERIWAETRIYVNIGSCAQKEILVRWISGPGGWIFGPGTKSSEIEQRSDCFENFQWFACFQFEPSFKTSSLDGI